MRVGQIERKLLKHLPGSNIDHFCSDFIGQSKSQGDRGMPQVQCFHVPGRRSKNPWLIALITNTWGIVCVRMCEVDGVHLRHVLMQ